MTMSPKAIEEIGERRVHVPEPNADGHGQEYPQGQVSVEE
jgi:hypothetical protein